MAWLNSVEQMVNLALARIGYPIRIGDMFEGSEVAKLVLDVYGQTRDQLLHKESWGFAERNVIMALLKSAPVYGYVPPVTWSGAVNPPLPWLFEYAYPADCIKVRAVKPTPIFIPEFDPQPYVWSVENDNYFAPGRKVILCNVPNAILTYTGQIIDITLWEPDFIEALAPALGERLAAALKNLDEQKIEAVDEQRQMIGSGDDER